MKSNKIAIAAILLWVITVTVFTQFIIRGNTVAGTDNRTAVVLAVGERALILSEMRSLLAGTYNILEGINRNDLKQVSQAACAVGMASTANVNPALMAKLPTNDLSGQISKPTIFCTKQREIFTDLKTTIQHQNTNSPNFHHFIKPTPAKPDAKTHILNSCYNATCEFSCGSRCHLAFLICWDSPNDSYSRLVTLPAVISADFSIAFTVLCERAGCRMLFTLTFRIIHDSISPL